MNIDNYKNSDEFAQLKIFESVLYNLRVYYDNRIDQLRDKVGSEYKNFSDKKYLQSKKYLEDQRKLAVEFIKKVEAAMADYRREASKINVFQSEKMQRFIDSLRDAKIKNNFQKSI